MTNDKLFLLKHDFLDNGERYYCPECVQLHGVLNLYPALQDKLEVCYVDFPRPRSEIISEIGEQNQGCPVLIVGSSNAEALKDLKVGQANGREFISGAEQIGLYLAKAYGIGKPH